MDPTGASAFDLDGVATPALAALGLGYVEPTPRPGPVDVLNQASSPSARETANTQEFPASSASAAAVQIPADAETRAPVPRASEFRGADAVSELRASPPPTSTLQSPRATPAPPRLRPAPEPLCPCCGAGAAGKCALDTFLASAKVFGIAYGAKAALAALLGSIRGGSRPRLEVVLKAFGGSDALRFGAFLGTTSLLTRVTRCLLARARGRDDKTNSFIAGLVGGLGIALDVPSRRKDVALYAFVRGLHTAAHTAARLGAVPDITGDFGTRFLFSLANAFIIYGFIMEPELLDAGYYRWILGVAGVPHEVLEWSIRDPKWARMRAQRRAEKGEPLTWPGPGDLTFGIGASNPRRIHNHHPGRIDIPPVDINQVALSAGSAAPLPTLTFLSAKGVPPSLDKASNDALRSLAFRACAASPSCSAAVASAGEKAGHLHHALIAKKPEWLHAGMVQQVQDPRAFRRCDTVWHVGQPCVWAHTLDSVQISLRSLRVYAPVHLVPLVLFRRSALLRDPVGMAAKTGKAIALSTAFLTSYVWLVKSALCTLRMSRGRDDLWQAMAAGAISFPSLALENRHRATELMLYCLTKGVSVAWTLAGRKGWTRPLPGGSTVLFCLALALFLGIDRGDFGQSHAAVLRFIAGEDRASVADVPRVMKAVNALRRLRERIGATVGVSA
jgi:hypothetical protein